MIQHFDKLRLILEKYQQIYHRSVEFKINSYGSGNIIVDTSRGGDTYHEILVKFDNWNELSRYLAKTDERKFLADPYLLEQCRPNSYYTYNRTIK